MTRYETAYAITYSGGAFAVTYASTYATETLMGGAFTISASNLNATDVLVSNGSAVTVLKWTKATAPSAASRAAFITAVLALKTSLSADTISEVTAAAGVTVDGVLLKDSAVTASGGVIASGGVTASTIAEASAGAGVTADGVLLKDSQVTSDQINEKTVGAGVTADGVLLKDSTVTITGAASAASDPADGKAVIYYDTTLQELRAKLTNTTTVSRLLASFTSRVYVAYYTSDTTINYGGASTEVALTSLNLTLPAGTYLAFYQFSLEPAGTTFAYVKSGGTADATDGTRVEASICVDSDGTRKVMIKPFVLTPGSSTLYQVVFMAGSATTGSAIVNNIGAATTNPDNNPVFVAIKVD